MESKNIIQFECIDNLYTYDKDKGFTTSDNRKYCYYLSKILTEIIDENWDDIDKVREILQDITYLYIKGIIKGQEIIRNSIKNVLNIKETW